LNAPSKGYKPNQNLIQRIVRNSTKQYYIFSGETQSNGSCGINEGAKFGFNSIKTCFVDTTCSSPSV